MTATSHYLTGVAVASISHNIWIAIPAAFASHFVLDTLPHFGDRNFSKRQTFWHTVWKVDFFLLVTAGFLTLFNAPWWFALVGFVATSPDIAWIYRFVVKEKWGKVKPSRMNGFNHFHARIQWGERLWGVWIELIYCAGISILLLH